jgi:RNA polymerase sigma-70 factor, ECF subfamily
MSDSEILEHIKENSQNFAILFNLHYHDIFGYIFRRIADFDLSKDIASDTFYKAFTSIKHFEYRGISIKVWLYRIATNEINLYFRHKRKQSFISEKLNNNELYLSFIEEDKVALEKELSLHRTYQELLTHLKNLPARYQDVISLRFFEKKQIKEISEILKINEGTVKSLLSRGLEKLKEKMQRKVNV